MHLESSRQMVVTWTTFDQTSNSTVYFGTGSLDKVAYGHQTKFIDGGNEKRQMFIHRVYLDHLKPKTTYSMNAIIGEKEIHFE